jgi:sporulation protein YlmC with PRC-barrel domain
MPRPAGETARQDRAQKEPAVTEPSEEDDIQARLIGAGAISGTAVYDTAGAKLGTVHDVMIDRLSGKVEYAILSFGGFLGLGSQHYPLPWHTLTYDEARGGYVVDIDPGVLHAAPSYDPEDISAWEDPTYGRQLYDYYGRPRV